MPVDPVNQFTEFRAPYPNHKVTTILPKPLFEDSRATEATVTVKRTMVGGRKVYVNSSDRVRLTLPFLITRQKSLELEAFLQSYQSATIRIDLYDGSQWKAQLIGEPVSRTAVDRFHRNHGATGKDLIEVTLIFSAERLN